MWKHVWLLAAVAACTSSSKMPSEDVATGELGMWQAAPALPVARANHCSVAIDDWVLAIGGNRSDGNGGFVNTDEIDAAQVGSDGTLGAWQVAGHLPSPGSQSTCTSDGSTVYVIDGIFDDTTKGGQVWTADLDATGTLAPMQSLGALPANVFAISEAAAVIDGALVVTTANTPDNGANSDQTFTIATPLGGTLAWTTTTWTGVNFRAAAELAFSDSSAYVIGGYHDPSVGAVTDAFVAAYGGADAHATTALPAATAFGRAQVVDSWLFVVGGRSQVFTGAGTTAVYAAPIAADGSLGAWTTPTALSAPRTNFAMTLAGDFLVLTGGAASGPGDTTVLVSRARSPAAATK